MSPLVRQATPQDVGLVIDILGEATRWLEQSGRPMWKSDELSSSGISADVDAGLFFLAECDGEAAGMIKFQLEERVVLAGPSAGAIGICSSPRDQETIRGRAHLVGSASLGCVADTLARTVFSSARLRSVKAAAEGSL